MPPDEPTQGTLPRGLVILLIAAALLGGMGLAVGAVSQMFMLAVVTAVTSVFAAGLVALAVSGAGARPSSDSCSAETGVGAPVRGSMPVWVFGKGMISRMLGSSWRMETSRSIPTANPACGGVP